MSLFFNVELKLAPYAYICIMFNAYEERTMATASLRTLSPKSKAYRSTSTFSSLKIASTVTETHRRENRSEERDKQKETVSDFMYKE